MIQDAIQEKLEKRAILREEKVSSSTLCCSQLTRCQALLHLLLKLSESVTRLESLLLIASSEQDGGDLPSENGLRMPAHLNIEDGTEERWVSTVSAIMYALKLSSDLVETWQNILGE